MSTDNDQSKNTEAAPAAPDGGASPARSHVERLADVAGKLVTPSRRDFLRGAGALAHMAGSPLTKGPTAALVKAATASGVQDIAPYFEWFNNALNSPTSQLYEPVETMLKQVRQSRDLRSQLTPIIHSIKQSTEAQGLLHKVITAALDTSTYWNQLTEDQKRLVLLAGDLEYTGSLEPSQEQIINLASFIVQQAEQKKGLDFFHWYDGDFNQPANPLTGKKLMAVVEAVFDEYERCSTYTYHEISGIQDISWRLEHYLQKVYDTLGIAITPEDYAELGLEELTGDYQSFTQKVMGESAKRIQQQRDEAKPYLSQSLKSNEITIEHISRHNKQGDLSYGLTESYHILPREEAVPHEHSLRRDIWRIADNLKEMYGAPMASNDEFYRRFGIQITENEIHIHDPNHELKLMLDDAIRERTRSQQRSR